MISGVAGPIRSVFAEFGFSIGQIPSSNSRPMPRLPIPRFFTPLLSLWLLPALNATALENPSAAFIQRSMRQLSEASPQSPGKLRVLFYGQSITAQSWTKTVEKELRQRFPSAQFEFHNPAIGGFTSPNLVRTAEHDLYPWYPDLLIFHVYGPIEQYEEIIRNTRQRTTAEIILTTDHIHVRHDNPDEIEESENTHSAQIVEVAKKYDCMLIDVRSKWRAHLTAQKLAAKDLLKDKIHLNDAGCDLMARLVGEELQRLPNLGDGAPSSGRIRRVGWDTLRRIPGGGLELPFEGNRVVAVSDGKGAPNAQAELSLDGRPLESFLEMWTATRPSPGPFIWMPAIKQIGFQKSPGAQKWMLSLLPDSSEDGKKLHFKVEGSGTGAEGEGWSDQRFVSPSGRVVIEAADWHVAWPLSYRKKTLPPGFQVTWTTQQTAASRYRPAAADAQTVLIQGCANSQHVLQIQGDTGNLGIGGLVIHTPAGK
jgi:hypothetical protein